MPDPVSVLHPRKLYEMIRACPTAKARAQAALEFVRGSTGATKGVLLLAWDGKLMRAASTGDVEAPPGLIEDAMSAWNRELDTPNDDSRSHTMDVSALEAISIPANPRWQSASGVEYERRLLSMYRSSRFIPVGMTFLQTERPLVALRRAHIEALCNALLDAGDVPDRAMSQSLNP
jgi:hypothetical protein